MTVESIEAAVVLTNHETSIALDPGSKRYLTKHSVQVEAKGGVLGRYWQALHVEMSEAREKLAPIFALGYLGYAPWGYEVGEQYLRTTIEIAGVSTENLSVCYLDSEFQVILNCAVLETYRDQGGGGRAATAP